MTSCNRDHSPILKRKEKERHMELVLREDKIHRIMLKSGALCKLAHISSPNCIWFKLLNHISDQLVIVKPAKLCPLEPSLRKKLVKNEFKEEIMTKEVDKENNEEEMVEEDIQPFQYVLAPLEQNVYARGRIVYLEHFNLRRGTRTFAYVHFIDEGFGAWMSTKCLARMDHQLRSHPWQAFPISLFGIRTGQNLFNLTKPNSKFWSPNFLDTLHRVMQDYEFFKVIPVKDSRRVYNYFEYARAEVFGLDSPEDSEGLEGNAESIAHRLVLEYKDFFQKQEETEDTDDNHTMTVWEGCLDRTVFDAKQQLLLKEPDVELTHEILAEIPRWRLKWPKHFHLGVLPSVDGDGQNLVPKKTTTEVVLRAVEAATP